MTKNRCNQKRMKTKVDNNLNYITKIRSLMCVRVNAMGSKYFHYVDTD